ncbi:MAG: hypothetical protein IH600_13900 [Bacteroidetes bacterium]|nr:hypothetical protein [Bacteroidota bacterium]
MRIFAHYQLRFYRRICEPVLVLSGEIEYRLVDSTAFPWDKNPRPGNINVYRQRFADGGVAFIGRSGEEVVFSAWLQRSRLRIDELSWTWNLPHTDAVVYDVETMDAWRGRGIYPEALRRLSGLLADEGLRYIWIYAEAGNTASLRGIEKAFFDFRGSLSALHVIGLTFRRGTVEGVNA